MEDPRRKIGIQEYRLHNTDHPSKQTKNLSVMSLDVLPDAKRKMRHKPYV